MINDTYGRLTVISYSHKDKRNNKMFLCKCSCGNEKVIRGSHLKAGKIKSCGCLAKESIGNRKRKHNLSDTRIYGIWKTMKRRCSDKNFPSYKYYGAKGVKVCDEWKEVESFYKWAMDNGYEEHLTIDRINPFGNYEPDNCRWATMIEQNNNTRRQKLEIK